MKKQIFTLTLALVSAGCFGGGAPEAVTPVAPAVAATAAATTASGDAATCPFDKAEMTETECAAMKAAGDTSLCPAKPGAATGAAKPLDACCAAKEAAAAQGAAH